MRQQVEQRVLAHRLAALCYQQRHAGRSLGDHPHAAVDYRIAGKAFGGKAGKAAPAPGCAAERGQRQQRLQRFALGGRRLRPAGQAIEPGWQGGLLDGRWMWQWVMRRPSPSALAEVKEVE